MTSTTRVSPSLGWVAIIDDDAAVRRSLDKLLRHEGYQTLVYESTERFLADALGSDPVDVVLSDMRMPGRSGVDLQGQLQVRGSLASIVFISGDSRPDEIIQAMKNGAVDFLLKPFDGPSLLRAVAHAVEVRQQRLAQQERSRQAEELLQRLTPREREICHWMLMGYSNQQISRFDGAASATIKLHRARVMEKMGVNSLAELMALLPPAQRDALTKVSENTAG